MEEERVVEWMVVREEQGEQEIQMVREMEDERSRPSWQEVEGVDHPVSPVQEEPSLVQQLEVEEV